MCIISRLCCVYTIHFTNSICQSAGSLIYCVSMLISHTPQETSPAPVEATEAPLPRTQAPGMSRIFCS